MVCLPDPNSVVQSGFAQIDNGQNINLSQSDLIWSFSEPVEFSGETMIGMTATLNNGQVLTHPGAYLDETYTITFSIETDAVGNFVGLDTSDYSQGLNCKALD